MLNFEKMVCGFFFLIEKRIMKQTCFLLTEDKGWGRGRKEDELYRLKQMHLGVAVCRFGNLQSMDLGSCGRN